MDILTRMQTRARERASHLVDPLSPEGRAQALNTPNPSMTVAQAEAHRMAAFRDLQNSVNMEQASVQDEIARINQQRTQEIANLGLNLNETQARNLSIIQSEINDIKEILNNSKDMSPDKVKDTLEILDSRINELTSLQYADANNRLKDINKNPEANKPAPYIDNAHQDIERRNNKTMQSGKDNVKDAIKNTEDETSAPKVVPNILTRENIIPLEANLKKKVFGQDEVIEKIVAVSKNAFTKLRVNKKKPTGSYFFAGPSGVGKTELARTMAESLGVPILIINMGEYAQEHETAKLLGAPPGYVGSEEPGIIPRFIEKNPNGIILFDEIEKAHPNADNILLSILDQGVCQDNRGNDVHFKETIVICTSNLGAKVEYFPNLTQEEKNKYRMEAIKARIRPEIIGRYDGIFHFHSLNDNVYKMIIDKFLNGITETVQEEHKLNLTFSEDIRKMIAKESYDPALGGRPAGKFIEQITVNPLADFLLREDYEAVSQANPNVTLDLNKDGNIVLVGNESREVLATMSNTKEVLEQLARSRFSDRQEMDNGQDEIAIEPPANPKPTPKVEVPKLKTQPQLKPETKKATPEEISEIVAPKPSRKPRTR